MSPEAKHDIILGEQFIYHCGEIMSRIIEEIRSSADEFSSLPFWSWNDRLEPGELRRQIRDMKRLNMGGFFMHARGGLITEYMSDEWFECINACIDEAEKLGMQAWAYDENGWPSGFGGGALLQDEKNFATALEYRYGGFPAAGDGSIVSVYEKRDDGSFARITRDNGRDDCLILYTRKDDSYVDTLNPEIADLFIEAIYEKYRERLPENVFGKGRPMPGFFTDEPQYYRWGNPYSDTLPEVFEKTYGYPIFDGLPAIFFDFDGADKFRYDYYYLIHRLFINGFIKKIYDWCEKNGVCLTGHAVEETTLNSQMMCAGSVMPFYEYETIPGIDYLGRQILDDLSFKQLGSACAQLGKKKRISEMFACCGWDVSPTQLKRVAEAQYASGINMMCQHLYPYSERGQRKTDYPLHYSEHNPWHDHMADFNAYFRNLGAILSRGKEYAPILVIHPIHGAFCKYRKNTDSLDEIEKHLFSLSRFLGENQIPYHYGDEWMMQRMAEVRNGRIRVGLCEYEAVIVPFTYSLDRSTADLLRRFSGEGGKIFLYRGIPQYIDGKDAGCDLDFLRSNISESDLLGMRDAVISCNGRNIKAIRKMTRLSGGERIVFITNTGTEEYPRVSIRLPVGNWSEISVPDLCEKPVHTEPGEKGFSTAVLSFEEGESHVLVCSDTDKAAGEAELPPVYDSFIPVPDRIKLVSSSENILTLDMPGYSFDGENYEEPLYIMGIRDMLLRMRHEGRVWIRYDFRAEYVPRDLRFVTEPVYRRITVNGHELSDSCGWWFDRSFRCFNIAGLVRPGTNRIVIEIDHHQSDYVYHVLYDGVSEALRNCIVFDCEIESSYLIGSFGLRPDAPFTSGSMGTLLCDGNFTITEKPHEISSENIVVSGYPFFGGSVTSGFTYTYRPGMPTVLNLDGHHAVAEVSVNGNKAGTLLWTKKLDVGRYLREGENEIDITIINSMRNTLGPHHYIEDELELVGRQMWTFENEWNGRECKVYKKRYSFVPFGIKK